MYILPTKARMLIIAKFYNSVLNCELCPHSQYDAKQVKPNYNCTIEKPDDALIFS